MQQKNRCFAGNLIWGLIFLLCISIIIFPESREVFLRVTENHPYILGFLKFGILATMGDLLGWRITNGRWRFPQGFFFKACLWGIIGMAITLVMSVYNEGVAGAMALGRLPLKGSSLALAFFSSAVMDLTFGPMLYIYHKFGELYIDSRYEARGRKVALRELVKKVDWETMVCFSWVKTCVFIWIPLHAIVFLLPSQYRVLASALLSVLLGVLIAVSKKAAFSKTPLRNRRN